MIGLKVPISNIVKTDKLTLEHCVSCQVPGDSIKQFSCYVIKT